MDIKTRVNDTWLSDSFIFKPLDKSFILKIIMRGEYVAATDTRWILQVTDTGNHQVT